MMPTMFFALLAKQLQREAQEKEMLRDELLDCKVTINYPLITISYMSRGTQYTESGAFLDKTKFRLTSSNGKVTSEYILQ